MTTLAELRKQYPDLAGLDDEQTVDALHQAFYADLPREEVASRLGVKPPAPPPAQSGFLRRALGDTLVSLGKGAIGVPEIAVGGADILTGGHVGKALENEGGVIGFRPKEAREFLDTWLSPEQQAANRKLADAKGIVETTQTALQNPSTIVQGAVESIPATLAGGVLARGALALVPKMSTIAAAGIGEGAISAAQTAEQIRQETPDRLLTPQQSSIAAGSGALTGALGALGGRVAKSLGIGDIDTMIAGGAKSIDLKKGFVRRVLEGALSEGVLEELPQSVQEQMAQNWALGKPLDEGVDQAAVLGMFAGGLMGGGAQAFHRPHVEDTGTLAKAANTSIDLANATAQAAAPPVAPTVSPAATDATPLAAQTPPGAAPPVAPPAAPVPGFAQFARAGVDPEQALADMHSAAAREAQTLRDFTPEPAAAMPPSVSAIQPEPRSQSDTEPAPISGDILNAQGEPFTNRGAAVRALRNYPDRVIASVKDGFVLRLAPEQVRGPVAPAVAVGPDRAEAPEPAPGAGTPGMVPSQQPSVLPVGPTAEPGAAAVADRDAGGTGAAAVPELTPEEVSREAIPSTPIDGDWHAFAPETGTKGVPRQDMPQIKAGDRSALVQFLRARGIDYEPDVEIPASSLKPTQAEFSREKVEQAKAFSDTDRSILVSSDGHVLDGHHQWVARLEAGEPIKAIRLNAPIDTLLDQVREFPSAGVAEGASAAPALESSPPPMAAAPTATESPRAPLAPNARTRAIAERIAAEQPAKPPAPTERPSAEVIELRKRVSVLESLRKCLAA